MLIAKMGRICSWMRLNRTRYLRVIEYGWRNRDRGEAKATRARRTVGFSGVTIEGKKRYP